MITRKEPITEHVTAEFQIEKTQSALRLTVYVKNKSSELQTLTTGNGALGSIQLFDDQKIPRLESGGSIAQVTTHDISPHDNLTITRETQTPEEAHERWKEIGSSMDKELMSAIEATPEIRKQEDVWVYECLDLSETNTTFTATAKIPKTEMSVTFTLDEI